MVDGLLNIWYSNDVFEVLDNGWVIGVGGYIIISSEGGRGVHSIK